MTSLKFCLKRKCYLKSLTQSSMSCRLLLKMWGLYVSITSRINPWGIASFVFCNWALMEALKSGMPVVFVLPVRFDVLFPVPLREWSGDGCPKVSESIRWKVPDFVRMKSLGFLKLELRGLASWSKLSSLFLRLNSALNSLSLTSDILVVCVWK